MHSVLPLPPSLCSFQPGRFNQTGELGYGKSSFLSDSALHSAAFQEKKGDPPTHFGISVFSPFLSSLPPVFSCSLPLHPAAAEPLCFLLFILFFLFCDSPWVWLKVILQHWLTFSAQGAARREGEEIQGRGLRAAAEGEGGSRADRLSTGPCSHHFLLQT